MESRDKGGLGIRLEAEGAVKPLEEALDMDCGPDVRASVESAKVRLRLGCSCRQDAAVHIAVAAGAQAVEGAAEAAWLLRCQAPCLMGVKVQAACLLPVALSPRRRRLCKGDCWG